MNRPFGLLRTRCFQKRNLCVISHRGRHGAEGQHKSFHNRRLKISASFTLPQSLMFCTTVSMTTLKQAKHSHTDRGLSTKWLAIGWRFQRWSRLAKKPSNRFKNCRVKNPAGARIGNAGSQKLVQKYLHYQQCAGIASPMCCLSGSSISPVHFSILPCWPRVGTERGLCVAESCWCVCMDVRYCRYVGPFFNFEDDPNESFIVFLVEEDCAISGRERSKGGGWGKVLSGRPGDANTFPQHNWHCGLLLYL